MLTRFHAVMVAILIEIKLSFYQSLNPTKNLSRFIVDKKVAEQS